MAGRFWDQGEADSVDPAVLSEHSAEYQVCYLLRYLLRAF